MDRMERASGAGNLEQEYKEALEKLKEEALRLQEQFASDQRKLDERLEEETLFDKSKYDAEIEMLRTNFLDTLRSWFEEDGGFKKFFNKIPDSKEEVNNIRKNIMDWLGDQTETI